MSHETTDAFGFPTPEQPAPQGGRFNRMLHNPNLQSEARRIATNVGGDAIQGALEANGLVRDDGSIRKFRTARKLATNPTGFARRAATGAFQGARQSAQAEAVQQTQAAWGAVQERATNAAPTYPAQPKESDPWGDFPSAAEPNPFTNSYNAAPSTQYGMPANPNAYSGNQQSGWGEPQPDPRHQQDFGFGDGPGFPEA